MKDKKILCIDYGIARIGIAVSDATQTIANAKAYIKNDSSIQKTAAKIAKLASEYNTEKIVIGNPKKLNGSDGRCSDDIKKLKQMLEENFKLNIILWDERFSSISAENTLIESGMRRKDRKEKIDSVAAAIILQNYLDFINNQSQ